jgi:crotonobetainyl-CoA:carnitine CoA-transferase CaiB-like acyl-CoA transferase
MLPGDLVVQARSGLMAITAACEGNPAAGDRVADLCAMTLALASPAPTAAPRPGAAARWAWRFAAALMPRTTA